MRKMARLALIVLALLALGVVAGGAASAQPPVEARVLAWETIQLTQDGRLLALTAAGGEEVLKDFGSGVFDRVAKVCGQHAWSAGGQGVAIFTGPPFPGETPDLATEIAIYPIAGGPPVSLGKAQRMACSGPATFQFSPNGQRVGFVNYVYGVLDLLYPQGTLQLYDSASGTMQGSFDNTTAFALYDDGALMLRLYPDEKGNAIEGDVDWWDGTARRTLVTVEPVRPPEPEDVECSINGGAVIRIGDQAYILTGEKCEVGSSTWRLVSVPMAGGAATEIARGESVGGFFPGNFTLNLFPAKDGSGFLMTYPSGLARNTVRMQWITPDGVITPLLADNEHVVVDREGNRLFEGRHLMLSPDGSGLAFVTVGRTLDDDQEFWLLDMSTVGSTPVLLEQATAGQRVFDYRWAANNTLFYAVGIIESSSLQMVTVGGSPQRIERGRFYRIMPSYNGDKVAASEFMENPERINDDIYKLSVLTPNGIYFTLRQGTELDNEFIPLAIQ